MAEQPFNEKGYTVDGPGGTALGAYNTPPSSAPVVAAPISSTPVTSGVTQPYTSAFTDPNLGEQNNTGLTAKSVSYAGTSPGINLQDATYEQVTGVFGPSGIDYYGIQRKANGRFVITDANLKALSENVNKNAIASSSDSVVAGEQSVTNAVQGLNAPTTGETDAQTASAKYISLLDEQMASLEARRKSETDAINAGFDVAKTRLEGQQKDETGSTAATLARIGGYLGPSASATGALLKLAQEHKYQMLDLEAKRSSAINEANNAITDKQFTLARAKLQEVKDIEAEVYNRKQDFFNNTIKVQQEARQQDEAVRTQIKDDLEKLSLLEPSQVPSDKKAEIDQFYGVAGFTDKYLSVASSAAKAKSQKDVLETQQKMLDLLQDIPQGQEVRFPDGTSYTGIGKVSDITTYLQTDADGISHLVTYNKGNKNVSVQSLGAIGKPSGGSGGSAAGGVSGVDPTTVDNVVSTFQITMEQNKDATSRYYDPDIYIGVREELKKSYPQLLRYTDNLFLNESNGFFSKEGISRLRQKGIFYDASATAATFGQPVQVVESGSETQSEQNVSGEDDKP